MKKHFLYIIIAAGSVLFACHTMLVHPDVTGMKDLKNPDREYVFESAHHGTVCSECHQKYSGYTIKNPYRPEDEFTRNTSQKYLYFNQYPWWIDELYDRDYSEEVAKNPYRQPHIYIPRNTDLGRTSYGPENVISPTSAPAGKKVKMQTINTNSTGSTAKPAVRNVTRTGKKKADARAKKTETKTKKKRKKKNGKN